MTSGSSLLADQWERWERGDCVRVEEYLASRPALDNDTILDLVYREVLLRQHRGETPTADEYLRRFPQLAEDIRLHFEVHAALGSAGDEPAIAEPPVIPGFQIRGLLGRGGMGVVYRARQNSLERDVALKFLPPESSADPQALGRFRREARTASALNHPHICTIYDLAETGGATCIVMELVAGRTVQTMLGERSADDAAAIIRQAALALDSAHRAGVVHRDIKPANLMVRDDGLLKVLDFGLARLARPGLELTHTGPAVVGTLRYMSPEQLRGDPAEGPSDVFSLGIVWYELITGTHPFASESVIAAIAAAQFEPPASPSRRTPALPPAHEALILKMLAKHPAQRPTLAAVIAELASTPSAAPQVAAPPRIVGRRDELSRLRRAFDDVAKGRGLVMCVAGEPGIGKTTIVEQFLAELPASATIAAGRCSERLAGAEAYLPVLEALESLLRGPAGDSIGEIMQRTAATWYAQCAPAPGMPASQDRRSRELIAFLDELSRRGPIVLFLDDLHWADASTTDLLAYLGTRCTNLALMILVTYRPSDLLLAKHPFAQVKLELQSKGTCSEVALPLLTQRDVEALLAARFPDHRFPATLAELICQRTDGSPLFVAELLRYLVDQGSVAEVDGHWTVTVAAVAQGVPDSVKSLIRRQYDRLDDLDRRLLSAASVQGAEFDSAIVARALEADPAVVEERLTELERVHAVVRKIHEHELPDRTLSLRFGFVHALFQNAFYDALAPSRRAALSLSVADALIVHYGDRAKAIDVAILLETARDPSRAHTWFRLAAEAEVRESANREAIALIDRALDQLHKLPETPERGREEVALLLVQNLAMFGLKGFAHEDVGRILHRALALCAEPADEVGVLYFLSLHTLMLGDIPASNKYVARLDRIANIVGAPPAIAMARAMRGINHLHAGDPATSLVLVRNAIDLANRLPAELFVIQFGSDLALMCRSFVAWAQWLLGNIDQALTEIENACVRAERTFPVTAVHTHSLAAFVYQLQRDPVRTLAAADEGLRRSIDLGLAFYGAISQIWRGWAIAQTDIAAGLDEMTRGQIWLEYTHSGALAVQIHTMFAEVIAASGDIPGALAHIATAHERLVSTGEGNFEAEMHRIEGVIRHGTGDPAAEACLRKAIEVSRRQGVRSFELRAATDLHRCVGTAESRQLLERVYRSFSEGFGAPDLIDARALLDG